MVTSPDPAPAALHPIRLGDIGEDVRDVQRRLRRLGAELDTGGVFDLTTDRAVRGFQRTRGLAADGIIGPETWRELVEAGHQLGDRLLWQSRVMLRGDDVRELQQRLNRLGFDAGQEDGIFGPLVRAAVEEFQRNVGLEVDGVAGPQTVGALRRLHRDHQAGGAAGRVREREWRRQLAGRGLAGTRVLVDPAHGAGDPGVVGPGGLSEAEVAWDLGRRLAGRLAARGADVVLSRGPASAPTPGERAVLANEQGADVVVSVACNHLETDIARGCATYYYGAPPVTSAQGEDLAEMLQAAMVGAGWGPDCRTHPVTWTLLRETRMPAVVVEPAFLSCPDDEARLSDPVQADLLAAALAAALAAFVEQGGLPDVTS
jgi:N-acetylmuramoyl-L-alanine amidase